MPETFQQLIDHAHGRVGIRELTADMSIGKVACAVKTRTGKIYTGINVKAAGSLGFCAEVMVLSQMINEGETEIELFVGINEKGTLITPCGRCRELLYQLNRSNRQTQIIVSPEESFTLEELLPHRWQEYWGGRG